MKPDLKISIPKPCSANWNEMTPNEKGKFCGLCSLTVVDFTKMNEAEIKDYFKCHYGQKTCGRFTASQLARPLGSGKNFWERQIEVIERKYKQNFFRTSMILFLAFISLAVGCRRSSPTIKPHMMGDVEIETMGEPKVEQVDTLKKDHIIGDTIYIEEPVKDIIQK